MRCNCLQQFLSIIGVVAAHCLFLSVQLRYSVSLLLQILCVCVCVCVCDGMFHLLELPTLSRTRKDHCVPSTQVISPPVCTAFVVSRVKKIICYIVLPGGPLHVHSWPTHHLTLSSFSAHQHCWTAGHHIRGPCGRSHVHSHLQRLPLQWLGPPLTSRWHWFGPAVGLRWLTPQMSLL